MKLLSTIVVLTIALARPADAQPMKAERSGQDIFRAACAACHGADGKGQPIATVGFDTPLPDFTSCSFATPETAADWIGIAHQGGPVRAFDRRMPAFGEVLSDDELTRTIDYVRSLCAEPAWPRGELNLPRALVTEKAFPENEALLTTSIAGGDAAAVENALIYEKRIGPRSQVEFVVPLAVQKDSSGAWQRGLGDVAIAFKHALFHSLDSGTIVSAAAEVVLPTGKETQDLGKGVTIVEPFVALGQILPSDGFVQFQGGVELPTDGDRANKEAFWRVALGKTFVQNRFGRSWSPMLELLGAREIDAGEGNQWDLVPQVQISLSRRQHILLSGGVSIPLTNRGERDIQVLTYFLWDWFDGGLFDGWR